MIFLTAKNTGIIKLLTMPRLGMKTVLIRWKPPITFIRRAGHRKQV